MQLTELLLTSIDLQKLQRIIDEKPQSILITAPKGYGKASVLEALALALTNNRPEHIHYIAPNPDSISIEEIRNLKKFFTLKTNSAAQHRAAIIRDADTMTIEAQNALLKTLEEPPKNCTLLLSASRPVHLLPTIHSRVATIQLSYISEELATAYFVKSYNSKEVIKAYRQSTSLPATMLMLLKGEDTVFVDAINLAKKFITSKGYERLVMASKIVSGSMAFTNFLDALVAISQATLQGGTLSEAAKDKWIAILSAAHESQEHLNNNINAKLVYTNLSLSM